MCALHWSLTLAGWRVLNAVRADFDDLERLLDAMEERAGDAVEFAELDASFHARLAETTRNPLLIWITTRVNSVRAQTEWVRMRQQTLNNSIIETYNRQHGGNMRCHPVTRAGNRSWAHEGTSGNRAAFVDTCVRYLTAYGLVAACIQLM